MKKKICGGCGQSVISDNPTYGEDGKAYCDETCMKQRAYCDKICQHQARKTIMTQHQNNSTTDPSGKEETTMKAQYRNGDDISLSSGCNGCNPSMINGTLCHEQGCPDAWRDNDIDCYGCGYAFLRAEREERVCADCQSPEG